MDKEKIAKLIKWKKSVGTSYHDIMKDFVNPLLESLGDDESDIITYLNTLSDEDIVIVSSAFEDIYKKFPTEDMWKTLEVLEQKLC